jgi:hypothetical protein
MILQDFTYVDLPRDTVRRYLTGEGAGRLTALAARAAVEGEALCGRGDGDTPASRIEIMVGVGNPLDIGDVTLVPLAWRSRLGAGTLATVDLELASLGPTRTQLTLLGRAADTRQPGPFHRRVIQATMRSFLSLVARELEDATATVAAGPGGRRLPLAG